MNLSPDICQQNQKDNNWIMASLTDKKLDSKAFILATYPSHFVIRLDRLKLKRLTQILAIVAVVLFYSGLLVVSAINSFLFFKELAVVGCILLMLSFVSSVNAKSFTTNP